MAILFAHASQTARSTRAFRRTPTNVFQFHGRAIFPRRQPRLDLDPRNRTPRTPRPRSSTRRHTAECGQHARRVPASQSPWHRAPLRPRVSTPPPRRARHQSCGDSPSRPYSFSRPQSRTQPWGLAPQNHARARPVAPQLLAKKAKDPPQFGHRGGSCSVCSSAWRRQRKVKPSPTLHPSSAQA